LARNERIIKVSPRDVFDVLSDPRGYAYWVLGSMEIRNADSSWPAQGSRLHHTVGVGRLRIRDHTTVEAVENGRHLQLKAQTGPLGSARVKLSLEEVEGGTRVTMVEDPADKPTAFVFMPLTHLLMRARNVRSLDRLAELAERRTPMPGEEPGAPIRTLHEDGAVENPRARRRR
jgi:uncharacterized protein YndB with AHSA1/START domain